MGWGSAYNRVQRVLPEHSPLRMHLNRCVPREINAAIVSMGGYTQVGWLAQSGAIYGLNDDKLAMDLREAGFTPLYIARDE